MNILEQIKQKKITNRIQKVLLEDLSKDEIAKIQKQLYSFKERKLLLTMKLKIRPTSEQEEILWKLSENCRLLYNFALEERMKWWERNKNLTKKKREKNISFASQCRQLTQMKKEFPRYSQNHSKSLQQILKSLDANFKSFFALKNNGNSVASQPRFKGKKYFTTLQYNQTGFKILKNKIWFNHFYPTKEDKNKVDLTFQITSKIDLENKDIKHVNLFQDHKTKSFFVSIVYEEMTNDFYDNGICQAIDQGVMNIVAAVNSHAGKSLLIKNQRANTYWQPKYNELQSKRDHCKRYSNKWHWYNNKLRKCIRKGANQNKDFQHKLSKKIIANTKATTIVIGDLSAKKMSLRRKGDKKSDKTLHRNMQNTGAINRFAQFLTYKAMKKGKRVIRISERNTTKRCSYCGNKKNRKLSERVIKCDCGLIIDRDINAAVNIMQRFFAILTLSQKRPVTGQRLLKDFRHTFFAINSLGIRLPKLTLNEFARITR